MTLNRAVWFAAAVWLGFVGYLNARDYQACERVTSAATCLELLR